MSEILRFALSNFNFNILSCYEFIIKLITTIVPFERDFYRIIDGMEYIHNTIQ